MGDSSLESQVELTDMSQDTTKLLQYCALARHAIEEKNQENADKFVELALKEEGGLEHPEALEVTAMLMVWHGDMESAHQCIERAVDGDKMALGDALNQNKSVTNKADMVRRMISLAEYYRGNMALELYKTAIELCDESNKDTQRVSSMISASCAELYLSEPLCMKSNAQTECKKYIDQSTQTNPKNVDALSLLTSWYMSSEDITGAKQSLLKTLELYESLKPTEDQSTSEESLTNSQKIRILQLCTELGQYEKAIEIGEDLLDEDSTQYQVFYYMGWAASLSDTEELRESSRQYLDTAQKLLKKLKKTPDFQRQDKEFLEHVNELIEKTGGPLPEIDVSQIPDAEVEAAIFNQAAETPSTEPMEE